MSSLIKAAQSPTEMRDIAARICRDYLTGAWKTITAEEIQLKRISGGLSNFLYYVSLPDHSTVISPRGSFSSNSSKRARKDSYTNILEPKEVLLRIYGQTHGEHALETMLTESVVFTLLSERKLGPKLHGIFPGGRIEQYIPARALVTSELSDPKISIKIAEKMGEIHSLEIPVSKEPDWLWNTMNRWLKSVEKILKSEQETNTNKTGIDLKKIDYRKELEWLKNVIETSDFPVVFSHNDLQEGNILFREDFIGSDTSSLERFSSPIEQFDDSAQLDTHFSSILISPDIKNNDKNNNHNDNNNVANQHDNILIRNSNSRKRILACDDDHIENDLDNTRDSVLSGNSNVNSENMEPELMIIDFEYCAYNYRGFDIANHFLEWTFDYTNEQFPYFYHKSDQYPSIEQQERFISTYLTRYSDDDTYQPCDKEIEEVMNEVKCFTLASHLFWSLWSIVNVHQNIEFGYWEYGACRIREYFQAKELYTK